MTFYRSITFVAVFATATSLILASRSAGAFEVFKVGGDADCAYTTIQDALDAAAAFPGTDYVWIATSATYTGQNLFISDSDGVIVEGGFTSCDDFVLEPNPTTISGAGNNGSAVFTIRNNSSVTMNNLFITGAQRDGDASGGGIDFDGSGELDLITTTVSVNSAGYGAGVNVKGDGAPVSFVVEHDTLIVNNTAQVSGGGVRLEGDVRMLALQPQTLIGFNRALGQSNSGYGGGVEVIGPAQADIGSSGYSGLAVIDGNYAEYGGGISINDSDDNDSALVRIFTTDPEHPVEIYDNGASATGGGVYLKPHSNIGFAPNNRAVLCAYDFVIDGNVAQEGAAIYADEDGYGSTVALNTAPLIYGNSDVCNSPEPPAVLGAVACAAGVDCNRVDANIAQLADGTPTDGSTILVQSDGALIADRFSMHGNQGAHAIRFVDDDSGDPLPNESIVEIQDCLLVENAVTQELVYADPDTSTDGTQAIVDRCTIASNQIGADHVMHMAANFAQLTNSIVDQPGLPTMDYAGPAGDLAAGYVLTSDASTLPGGVGIIEGQPSFVDSANGDYHLQRTSLGVDFAPKMDGSDLDGLPRTVDLIDIPDTFGPMDLGAYEIQTQILGCATTDTIFCDGFED